MRGAAFACAVLVGCYAPTPPAGIACSPSGACPLPYRCVAGVCAAPGDVPDGAIADAATGDAAADGAPLDAPADAGTPDGALVCPPSFTLHASGSCHRGFDTDASWLDAEAQCEALGAHLVVVETMAEASSLPAPIWIGVSDRVTEGTYRAVTGATITFTYFDNGEPSGGSQDCIHTSGGNNKRWKDGPCDFPFPFVCEYDGVPADPSAY